MTDQPFKIFQTHEQDLKSYFSPIVEEIMRIGDVEDGSPAGKIETVSVDRLLGEDGLAKALLTHIDDYYCLAFDITEAEGAETEPATPRAWLGVRAEMMPEEIPEIVPRPVIILVPPWEDPPECINGAGEDPGVYIEPDSPSEFFEALMDGAFPDRVPGEQLLVTAAILGNCKPNVDCPGVLGCWT